jgi:hypothetical protein
LAATVSGGEYNTAGGQYATVAGGYGNSASGGFAVVGGGEDNVASGDSYGDTTVAGGFQNVAGADDATVGGGFNNQATNTFATVPGGTENVAGGQFSFAAGNQAEALHGGAFVWSDGEGTPFASTTTNQFSVRANGGVRFVTSGAGLTVDGVPMPTNSAVLSLFSNPGSGNLFAGQNAGNPAVSGYGDIAVGGGALENIGTGSDNAAAGVGALEFNTAGSYNAGFGTYALEWNSTGSYNTASGFYALSAQGGTYVTGNGNTADGAYSLYSIETGSNNVAIGFGTLQYALSDNGEVAVGYQALQNVAGSGGGLTIGYANTGIGYQALQQDTYGSDNTAIGYAALNANVAGNNNLAIGTWALLANNGGQNNTAVGAYALGFLSSGSGNIAVGEGAGSGLSSGNNNIYIGSPAGGNENNVIRIGSGQTQTFLSGTSLAADLNVDPNGYNIGNVNSNAVTFGISSGEGICSKRGNGAANRYDLELWTDFTERLKVAQGGNVGINTDNPQQPLEVNGNYLLVDGGGAGDGDGPIDAYIGGNGGGSDVQIGSMNSSITAVGFWNTAANAYMHIYCSSITIEGGSDLAEPFQISPAEQPVAEGDVVVIDDTQPGRLKLTDQPYDTRVAGVVSGANGIHPGIQMQQQGLLEGGKNVALTGRVYVQADTSNGSIKPGDLLTTSATPGRAMRVTDHARAQGAILGKAMSALPEGRGMVLVLVTLQ